LTGRVFYLPSTTGRTRLAAAPQRGAIAPVISLCAYRKRRAAQRACDLSWVALELLELDAMAVEVRSRMALAETNGERDRHLRYLSRLGAQRAVYLEQQRQLSGGRRG
jgi:hypothetical protein